MLLEAGMKFLENLAKPAETISPQKFPLPVQSGRQRVKQEGRRRPEQPLTLTETIEDAVSELVKEDPVTRLPTFSIALPPSLTAERIAQTLAGALMRLTGRWPRIVCGLCASYENPSFPHGCRGDRQVALTRDLVRATCRSPLREFSFAVESRRIMETLW